MGITVPGKKKNLIPLKHKTELMLQEEEFNTINAPQYSHTSKSIDSKSNFIGRSYRNNYGSVLTTTRDLKALVGNVLD